MQIRSVVLASFFGVSTWINGTVEAVIVYDDSGPTRHLTSAGLVGDEADLWDLSGNFKGFLGTPISSKHFITADHATNNSFTSIVFSGGANVGSYSTVARFEDPDSDLQIWEISGTFNEWVELYRDSDEVGQTATLLGRGREAGAEVSVGGELKGWQWGADDQAKSWGRNVVSETANGGELIGYEFNAIDDADEGGLASRDSGGGAFLYDADDGRWELAGIHFAVDGPFRELATPGGEFNATLFDMGGLYADLDGTGYNLVPDMAIDAPSSSYSTRISDHLVWIDSIIPEPGSTVLLIGAGCWLMGRRRSA